jgi:hypothetical protein
MIFVVINYGKTTKIKNFIKLLFDEPANPRFADF